MLNRRPSVLHVVELAQGGITTYLLNLIAHQQAGGRFSRVMVAACGRLISAELPRATDDIFYYRSSRKPHQLPRVVAELRRIIRAADPDVVHLHSSFPGLYGRLALMGATKRPKIIYCPHGWSFTQDVDRVRKTAFVAVERLLSRWTDGLVNVSFFEAAQARRFGIHGRVERAIQNGVSDVRHSTDHPVTLVLDPRKINLGFVGRFDRQKGVDLLLGEIRRRPYPNIDLTLVGSTLRDQDGFDTGPARRIGWIGHDRIDAVYQAFDAIVLPSRWEAFGYVAIEAMRNGRPVIVSDRSALPEVVIHGFNGYVFSLDDMGTLAEILDGLNKAKLLDMGRNARLVYQERFALGRFLGETDQLYEEVLSLPPSALPQGAEGFGS